MEQPVKAFARVLASADALIHGCEAETFCMVAAEAKASGLPLIVPDEGGAGDQFTFGQGRRYRARDGADLARVIISFLSDAPCCERAGAVASSAAIGDIGQHFAMLFATYANSLARRAAA